MSESLDLDEIRKVCLNRCGPHDAGVNVGCACPGGDYRPVMLRLVEEVERLRAARDDPAPDEEPAPRPSERVEFVEHERDYGACVVVRLPGSTPRELGTLLLAESDWDVLRRVLSKAGPSVTFVRYSWQAGARDVA